MTSFTKNLLLWHKTIDRGMPWKLTKDPYKIWISEIILQQTRVQQGLPYYERFIARFPTVQALAQATEDEVLKLWQGLGYYSRARNLHHAAKHIVLHFEGTFPSEYSDILSLKGIGPYSAAAIASFAFDLPHAVIDGNVQRVLARFFGIDKPINVRPGSQEIEAALDTVFDNNNPAAFNQAIMDFGATLCTPQLPSCLFCPLNKECASYRQGIVANIPIKLNKVKIRKRTFHYLHITDGSQTYLHRRDSDDIWKGLYQFPLWEQTVDEQWDESIIHNWAQKLDSKAVFQYSTSPKIHKLTHQHIKVIFHKYEAANKLKKINSTYILVKLNKLGTFALPIVISNYLDRK